MAHSFRTTHFIFWLHLIAHSFYHGVVSTCFTTILSWSGIRSTCFVLQRVCFCAIFICLCYLLFRSTFIARKCLPLGSTSSTGMMDFSNKYLPWEQWHFMQRKIISELCNQTRASSACFLFLRNEECNTGTDNRFGFFNINKRGVLMSLQ